jgi:hypothetical protein
MNEGDEARREQVLRADELKVRQFPFEPLQLGPLSQRPSDESAV